MEALQEKKSSHELIFSLLVNGQSNKNVYRPVNFAHVLLMKMRFVLYEILCTSYNEEVGQPSGNRVV